MSLLFSLPNHPRRAMLFGALACVVGGGVVWRALRPAPALQAEAFQPPNRVGAASVVDDSLPVPDFKAIGPAGELGRAQLMGAWSLVFFGYTQCPDVCPTTLGMLATAFKQVPEAARPKVLFISVDPVRDTPALLAAYLPAFDAAFQGAAAQDADIAALTKHLGVHYERHAPGAQGQYTVDHTASMFLLDPQARLKAVFSPPHDDAAATAEALKRLCA